MHTTDLHFRKECEDMILTQIVRRGIRDERILEAFRKIPRHLFVPENLQASAYADGPLPIGLNQTISQPYIVALMTSLLQLTGGENVLEIGTGSGYQAAILSRLAKTVHTVEIHSDLVIRAKEVIASLGITNVHVHVGDGSAGWLPDAPYHAIMVTAAAPAIPPPLLQQLTDQGRMVVPVGPPHGQMLEVWYRSADRFSKEYNIPVSFVPLRGKHGWTPDEWES